MSNTNSFSKMKFDINLFDLGILNSNLFLIKGEQKAFFGKLLKELDTIQLVNQLLEMKVYYQVNPDPRNKENKSLYAKAVLPKFGVHQKRKSIGVHFGTLSNFPKGWTIKNKEKARAELIKKGFQLLSEN